VKLSKRLLPGSAEEPMSHAVDVQQSPSSGPTPDTRRDEVLRAAGVRMPTRPVTERRRFTARPRPRWLAAIIRLFS
jgi:hypothetical protein